MSGESLLLQSPNGHAGLTKILSTYEESTGRVLSRPTPTENELLDVVQWIDEVGDIEYRRVSIAIPDIYSSLTSKVNILGQFRCPICSTKEVEFPTKIIPIRITPVSKQAIGQQSKKRAAFERAIRYRFKGHVTPLPIDQSVCLLLVFVVRDRGQQKDLDNMAKALIDAVKNILFGDDRKIDHLNIIRIKSPDEEFVYLNIRQTKLNQHDEVLVPRMLHSWCGEKPLNIEDFIE